MPPARPTSRHRGLRADTVTSDEDEIGDCRSTDADPHFGQRAVVACACRVLMRCVPSSAPVPLIRKTTSQKSGWVQPPLIDGVGVGVGAYTPGGAPAGHLRQPDLTAGSPMAALTDGRSEPAAPSAPTGWAHSHVHRRQGVPSGRRVSAAAGANALLTRHSTGNRRARHRLQRPNLRQSTTK